MNYQNKSSVYYWFYGIIHVIVIGLIFSWAIYNIIFGGVLPIGAYFIGGGIGFCLSLVFVKFLRNENFKLSRNNLLYVILLFFYLVGEVILNISAIKKEMALFPDINSGFGYFNEACAKFDSIRGYRWTAGEHRIVKLLNERVIYDQRFEGNNIGFYSQFDYLKKKENPNKKRYLLLGDSFSSGEFLAEPLADLLTQKGGPNFEVYSFSINGGGIQNWHNMYKKEIEAKYEYDGIILAVFGNDINRDFFMMHHLDTIGYTVYSNEIPQTFAEFESTCLPKANPYAPILKDELIDEEIEKINSKKSEFTIDLYLLSFTIASPAILYFGYKFNSFLANNLISKSTLVDTRLLKEAWGEDKFQFLEEIIKSNQESEKEVIIASIPYNQVITKYEEGQVLNEVLYIEEVARLFGCTFFDGYEIFEGLSQKECDTFFFENDIHWNQSGCNKFANEFASFLISKN